MSKRKRGAEEKRRLAKLPVVCRGRRTETFDVVIDGEEKTFTQGPSGYMPRKATR